MTTRAIIVKYYSTKPFAEIAKLANTSKQSIGQIVKHLGLPKELSYAHLRHYTPERIAAREARAHKGTQKRMRDAIKKELLANPFKPTNTIAKELETSPPTVYHVRAGLHKLWLANRLRVVQTKDA